MQVKSIAECSKGTFIKLPFVIKIIILSIFEWSLKTGFTVITYFQCLTLSNKYKRGKLLAYQLLCQMMVRQPDVSMPAELLAQFYQVLHQGLTSQDQVRNYTEQDYLKGRCSKIKRPGEKAC